MKSKVSDWILFKQLFRTSHERLAYFDTNARHTADTSDWIEIFLSPNLYEQVHLRDKQGEIENKTNGRSYVVKQ